MRFIFLLLLLVSCAFAGEPDPLDPLDRLANLPTWRTVAAAKAPAIAANVRKLSLKDWDALPGPVTVVKANQRGETQVDGLVLEEGQQIILLPHPVDSWCSMPEPNKWAPRTTWAGSDNPEEIYALTLYAWVRPTPSDEAEAIQVRKNPLIKGPGTVTLGLIDGNRGDNVGAVRVKLVLVEQGRPKK